mmetsp:Transcript_1040/g.3642  ORF Transcript_1040/g.3642 Transcript_1040/m.3642 type:complete len:296 (-) Transcript_1040:94-981(-)
MNKAADDDKAAELFDIGIDCVARGDFVGAEGAFQKSIGLASEPDALAHCNLGVARERLGNVDGAIDAYRRASKLDATDPFALVNLGDALVRQQRHREAERAYLAALAIQNDEHDEPWGTLNNLGVCYENMGDAARATKCYHKAVALRPQYVVARDNLRRLIKRPGAPATSAHQSAAHAAPPAELRAPPRTFVGPPSPQKASTYTENVSPPRSDAAAVHGPRAAAIDVDAIETSTSTSCEFRSFNDEDLDQDARYDCSLGNLSGFFYLCTTFSGRDRDDDSFEDPPKSPRSPPSRR